MMTKPIKAKLQGWESVVALLCALVLAPGDTMLYAWPAQQQGPLAEQSAPKIPNDQLDSLVAPIALYPDPLLSQVLVASTYPLEIIQLQQWLAQHKDLKGDALTTAVQKEDWDPSIQGMSALPDAVKQLADNIKWTTDLGNAFLAQQADVMDAVQRMRVKAKNAGNLKSTEQQKVEVQTVESKTVVVIQQANPEIVYVPSYNPVVVYGPPIYPYPPIYYPPPSYYAGAVIAFGVGIAIGAAFHGGWGYNCGWGHNNVNINVNNNYVSHYNKTNINNGNRNNINNGNRGGNNTPGSIIPSTAAALPIPTRRPQPSMVARRAGIPPPQDKRMPESSKSRAPDNSLPDPTEAAPEQIALVRMPVRARPTPARTAPAEVETILVTGRFRVITRRPTRAPSEERRAKPVPMLAARGVHPAWGLPVVEAHVQAVDAGD